MSIGLYTTLFDFFNLIKFKKVNKAKIETFVFKQIQNNTAFPGAADS